MTSENGTLLSESISRRVRSLRARERDALRTYAVVLDRQYKALEEHDIDAFEHCLRFADELVAELEAINRVNLPGMSPSERPDENQALLSSVQKKHERNLQRCAAGCNRLRERLESVSLPRKPRSIYRSSRDGGGIVDVSR